MESLTRLLKARLLYPANHDRVRLAARTAVAACQRSAGGEDPLRVLLRPTRARVGTDTIDLPEGEGRWLAQTFRTQRLGGLAIARAATAEDLLGFAELLAERVARRGAPEPWPDAGAPARVAPIPLEIHGDHSSRADEGFPGEHDAGRVARIAGDARVAETVRLLQSAFDRVAGAGPTTESDELLETIVQVAFEDAAMTEQRAASVVVEVLDSLRRCVVARELPDSTSGVLGLARRVAGRVFGRERPDELGADETLPSGRPEDAAVSDDLPALLAELEQLPRTPPPRELVTPATVELCVRSIRWHLCTDGSSPEVRRAAAGAVVAAYTESTGTIGAAIGSVMRRCPAERRERMVEVLLDLGHGAVLLDCELSETEWIARRFPSGFAEVLEAFTPDDRRLVGMLRDVLRLVPEDRLATSLAELARNAESGRRVAVTLAATGDCSLPLLERLASDADPAGLTLVVQALRDRALPVVESAAFRILPPWALDAEYLHALCVSVHRSERAEDARRESARLLRDFVAKHVESGTHHYAVLHAVVALGCCPGTATRECLAPLARWRPFASRAIRRLGRAAREALRTLQRTSCV
ncbi:MAG: hypothetical protein IPM29_25480 [Planctomycetes bacterium]|nr:hypothetical protein [Planctomycetota bacterium]